MIDASQQTGNNKLIIKITIVPAQSLNRIENIMIKGEKAHHKPFHILPQCFQKSPIADV